MAYREISETTKERIMASLLSGQGVNATARRFRVSSATVSRILADLPGETLKKMQDAQRAQLETLLLDCLEAHFAALMGFCTVAADPNYLSRQSAKGLAYLHHTMSETMLRLLEIAAATGIWETPAAKEEAGP